MKKYLGYLLLSFGLLPFFQYQFNPDAGPFISIAQKYLTGNFSQAINGYWSPFYSWLLVPFLFLKINPLIAAKTINIFAGLIALIGINKLSEKIGLSKTVKLIIFFIASIFLTKAALILITPDLFLTAILTWYLVFIFDKKYIHIALLGALAYLTKTYAFYFFLSHFLVIQAADYYLAKTKKTRQQIISHTALTISIFFIISGIWIVLISNKYQQITLGTTGKYNFAAFNPDHPGLPIHIQGLIKPVNQTAISSWEDPSFQKTYPWNPLQRPKYFWTEMKNIKNNFYSLITIYQHFSQLSLIIFIILLIFLTQLKKKILIIYLTLLYYPLAYLFFGVTDRFVWFCEILILLLGGYLLDKILKQKFSFFQKFLIVFFFILIFIKPQLSEIKWSLNIDKNLYDLSQKLKNNYQITNSKIAAISHINDWNQSYTIAYYAQNKYYGMIQNYVDVMEMFWQINYFKIDYLFVYGLEDKQAILGRAYPIILYDRKLNLTIYKIKTN